MKNEEPILNSDLQSRGKKGVRDWSIRVFPNSPTELHSLSSRLFQTGELRGTILGILFPGRSRKPFLILDILIVESDEKTVGRASGGLAVMENNLVCGKIIKEDDNHGKHSVRSGR